MSNAIEMELHPAAERRTRSPLHLKSLQEAAMKLADLKSAPKSLGTRELVSLLVCQTQRNRRMTRPIVKIHLRLCGKTDKPPVILRLGATNS